MLIFSIHSNSHYIFHVRRIKQVIAICMNITNNTAIHYSNIDSVIIRFH